MIIILIRLLFLLIDIVLSLGQKGWGGRDLSMYWASSFQVMRRWLSIWLWLDLGILVYLRFFLPDFFQKLVALLLWFLRIDLAPSRADQPVYREIASPSYAPFVNEEVWEPWTWVLCGFGIGLTIACLSGVVIYYIVKTRNVK